MKSNRLTLAMEILLVIFSFADFLFSFLEMKYLVLIDKKLFHTILQKEFNPIQSLTVGRNNCDEKQGYEPLFEYEFNGIPKSCFDGKELNFKLKEYCPIPIPEINPITISTWREKKICVKRYSNTLELENDGKYYPLFVLVNSSLTDDKYMQCGTIKTFYQRKVTDANDDSFEILIKNVYMLKQALDAETHELKAFTCPINFFRISNIPPEESKKNYFNWWELSGGYYLIASNAQIKSPLPMDFKISEGLFPCLENNRRSNRTEQFPLLVGIRYFNCNRNHYDVKLTDDEKAFQYDKRYKPIDELEKESFFQEVNLDMEYDKLPNLVNRQDITIWRNDLKMANFRMFIGDYYFENKSDPNLISLKDYIDISKSCQFWRIGIALSFLIILITLTSATSLMKMFRMIYHTLLFVLLQIISYSFISLNIYVLFKLHSDKEKQYKDYLTGDADTYDFYTKSSIKRYSISVHYKDFNFMLSLDFYCNIIMALFVSVISGRFLHQCCVWIRNSSRRKIVEKEIGREKLEEIFEIYREQFRKRKNK